MLVRFRVRCTVLRDLDAAGRFRPWGLACSSLGGVGKLSIVEEDRKGAGVYMK